jgi:N-acetylglucosaminyldiphosphoundecaprenol N-acetyl-beta-D-mannosaminyltransferase
MIQVDPGPFRTDEVSGLLETPSAPLRRGAPAEPWSGPGRASALGVKVDLLTAAQLIEVIVDAIAAKRRMIIGNLNLHAAYLNARDASMREFLRRADIVFVDGVPIIWWLRALGEPASLRHRNTPVDWVAPLLSRLAQQSWPVYYLGGRPTVAERCLQEYASRIPGLKYRTRHGYFDTTRDGKENRQIVADINGSSAQLLLVGMGMPGQERWILENIEQIEVPVIMSCGALADHIAGEIPTAPRAAAAIGLESTFRLVTQPRRVWRRYLLEPWALLGLCWQDLRRRRSPSRDGAP